MKVVVDTYIMFSALLIEKKETDGKSWDEKIFERREKYRGKEIWVWGM